MKNRQFELRRRLARHYHNKQHRNPRGVQFVHGVRALHDYAGIAPDALSWWDDCQLILGQYRIAVAWQHPRNVYQDLIETAAMDAVAPPPARACGLFEEAEKTYQRLGRSRKKVRYYTLPERPDRQAWYDALRAEQARLAREAAFSVLPSIKVETLNWCRYVSIVVPLEVRSVTELHALAALVRRVLRGETTLADEFPGYVYDAACWREDGLAERALSVVSHRVAGS